MIRVVVTGSECTGKSTLAGELGSHFGAEVGGEFARTFVARAGRPPGAADAEAIARGQMELESALAAGAPRLVIHDTDLLSTVVYARHYYGRCPPWVEEAERRRPVDLYLLAGIDVPWVPDGDQRDRGDRREEMQALFRDALLARGARFEELTGSPAERLERAIELTEDLLRAADREARPEGLEPPGPGR